MAQQDKSSRAVGGEALGPVILLLRVTFRLPRDKSLKDVPYGPDLDNLLKRRTDGLCETVFSGGRGGDSCVVALEALKVVVEAEPGVDREILPITAR